MRSGVWCQADPEINVQVKTPHIQADKGCGTSCQIWADLKASSEKQDVHPRFFQRWWPTAAEICTFCLLAHYQIAGLKMGLFFNKLILS